MKNLLIVLFLFLSVSIYGQNDSTINNFKSEIVELDSKISKLESEVSKRDKNFESTIDHISCQLSSTNILLMTFSVITALVAIGLGVYITAQVNTVKEVLNSIKQTQKEVNDTKKDIDTIYHNLFNDISQLYSDIINEEVNWILKKLEEDPAAISLYESSLLSKDLTAAHYPILKDLYIKLRSYHYSETNDEDKKIYLAIFFKYYIFEAIKDSDIKQDLVNNFDTCFDILMNSEIKKSTITLLEKANYDIDKYYDALRKLFISISVKYPCTINEAGDKVFIYELYNTIFKNIKDISYIEKLKKIVDSMGDRNQHFKTKFLEFYNNK